MLLCCVLVDFSQFLSSYYQFNSAYSHLIGLHNCIPLAFVKICLLMSVASQLTLTYGPLMEMGTFEKGVKDGDKDGWV